MSKHIYGMHDYHPGWAEQVKAVGRTAWVVETLEIGDDPNDQSGGNFNDRGAFGLTVIGRLNYSHHGNGTIPSPSHYTAFAQRCANYVKNSQGCTHWFIGNEPNLIGERPDKAVPITPRDYINCYIQCYQQIKKISTAHKVMVAPVAPYNVDTGPWIDYWRQMLEELIAQGVGTDGLPIHTYSRGPEVSSITSEQKMNAPFQAYYNGFRGYRDLLAAVSSGLQHLPAYITETDQLESWADRNSGWVLEAYREINDWNKSGHTPKISCLALYRWPNFDQWYIVGKQGVIDDWRQTMQTTNYLAPEEEAVVPPKPSGPYATVIAPAGANVRSGPGTNYTVLGAVVFETVLPINGRNDDKTWWRVKSDWGDAWVAASVVSVKTADGVPVVKPPKPPVSKPGNPNWLVGVICQVLGVDPILGEAFIQIESAGQASVGNDMVVRFETHVFRDWVARLNPSILGNVDAHFRFGSPPWTKQEWNPGNGWQPLHDQGQPEEKAAFNLAMTIHKEAAFRSISMGAGQILGSNYAALGYPSAEAMYVAFSDKVHGEGNQVAGMFTYLRANNLVEAARAKDWKALAAGYNGPGQADYYAKVLRDKYLELGGTP